MAWSRRFRPALFVLGAALVGVTLLGAKALTAGNGAEPHKPASAAGNGKAGGPVVLGTVDSDPQPVSYGLPPEEGLKAVTLHAAEILGVADQLGSIQKGRPANLVIATGDLLQVSTQVAGLFIDGKPLPPTSKHTRLYDRYRERLKQVKEGKAPLGTE